MAGSPSPSTRGLSLPRKASECAAGDEDVVPAVAAIDRRDAESLASAQPFCSPLPRQQEPSTPVAGASPEFSPAPAAPASPVPHQQELSRPVIGTSPAFSPALVSGPETPVQQQQQQWLQQQQQQPRVSPELT